jgi:hypothetical protein
MQKQVMLLLIHMYKYAFILKMYMQKYMHKICKQNMQNMQIRIKYAKICLNVCRAVHATELCKIMQNISYAETCNIRNHDFHA